MTNALAITDPIYANHDQCAQLCIAIMHARARIFFTADVSKYTNLKSLNHFRHVTIRELGAKTKVKWRAHDFADAESFAK